MPNFFVVGAPKSATTSLCKYLEQHPQIFVSRIKEPCFFAPEVRDFSDDTRARAREGALVFDWDDYLRLFAPAADTQIAVGEGSVSYLSSPSAPRAIRDRIPEARVLMMLRDPVDRLFSHYIAAWAVGVARIPFVPWVQEQRAIEERRSPRWGPVWPGLYGTHVQRYLDVFDARQVCIQLYEDFVAAPSRVYRDVLTFLGVDPSFPLDARVRHNVTRVPRTQQLAAPALAPIKRIVRRLMPNEAADAVRDRYLTKPHGEARADERDALIGLYRDEILLLQTLIGRDLSAWLSADRAVA